MTQLQQQLGQLQAQLAASEAEQQRLQRQNDALIISHQTISSRCAQLEHELKVISSPSAVQPATNVTQLQMMQQPLAPQQGNCQLNTQQAHKSTSSADSGTHDSTHKQLVHAKQASVASLLLEEQQSIHIQQLTADTKELQVALAAAEQRAAAAEAHEFTTQQQLAALQAQHQRLQQDASHLKQLCRRTLEDAAGSAERHHSEQHHLKQQLADMAAAVGAADAARRAAQRDEAAVLQAVAHITMQRDTASMEVQTLKQQLAATLPEADEAKLLLAAASKELAAAPELLRQQAAHAEQRAVAAEQRAAVADAFKVKAEVECNSVVARCSGGWMKLTPSMRGILAMLMQEARDARDVRGSCEPGCLACGLRISSTGSCKHCTAYTVF